jgi:DnaJ family protein C protein 9
LQWCHPKTPACSFLPRRKVYDTTGSVEDSEEAFGKDFEDYYEYYRGLHDAVTDQRIEEFAQGYRRSDAERADLLQHYERCKGQMQRVFQWVILSDPDVDSHRFKDLLDEAIKQGEIKRYKQYTTWAEKVAATKPKSSGNHREIKAPKRKSKANKEGEGDDLAAVILRRRNEAGERLSKFAEKYGAPDYKEPTEEEFQAARQRLEARQKRSKKQE